MRAGSWSRRTLVGPWYVMAATESWSPKTGLWFGVNLSSAAPRDFDLTVNLGVVSVAAALWWGGRVEQIS